MIIINDARIPLKFYQLITISSANLYTNMRVIFNKIMVPQMYIEIYLHDIIYFYKSNTRI